MIYSPYKKNKRKERMKQIIECIGFGLVFYGWMLLMILVIAAL